MGKYQDGILAEGITHDQEGVCASMPLFLCIRNYQDSQCSQKYDPHQHSKGSQDSGFGYIIPGAGAPVLKARAPAAPAASAITISV